MADSKEWRGWFCSRTRARWGCIWGHRWGGRGLGGIGVCREGGGGGVGLGGRLGATK